MLFSERVAQWFLKRRKMKMRVYRQMDGPANNGLKKHLVEKFLGFNKCVSFMNYTGVPTRLSSNLLEISLLNALESTHEFL